MNRKINTEMTSGVIGLIMTAIFFLSLEDISWMSIGFPKTVIYVMAFISVVLVVIGFVKPSREMIFNVGSNTRWMVTGVFFFLWVLLMPVLGFFVSTAIFMVIIVGYLAGARQQLTIKKFMVWIPVVLAEVTFFYLIFTRVLHVQLPEGMFF